MGLFDFCLCIEKHPMCVIHAHIYHLKPSIRAMHGQIYHLRRNNNNRAGVRPAVTVGGVTRMYAKATLDRNKSFTAPTYKINVTGNQRGFSKQNLSWVLLFVLFWFWFFCSVRLRVFSLIYLFIYEGGVCLTVPFDTSPTGKFGSLFQRKASHDKVALPNLYHSLKLVEILQKSTRTRFPALRPLTRARM